MRHVPGRCNPGTNWNLELLSHEIIKKPLRGPEGNRKSLRVQANTVSIGSFRRRPPRSREGKGARGTPQQIIDRSYNQADARCADCRMIDGCRPRIFAAAHKLKHCLRMLGRAQGETGWCASPSSPAREQVGGRDPRDGTNRGPTAATNPAKGRQQSDQGRPRRRRRQTPSTDPRQPPARSAEPPASISRPASKITAARPPTAVRRDGVLAVIDTSGDRIPESGLVETPRDGSRKDQSAAAPARPPQGRGMAASNPAQWRDGGGQERGGDDAGGSSGSPQEAAEVSP